MKPRVKSENPGGPGFYPKHHYDPPRFFCPICCGKCSPTEITASQWCPRCHQKVRALVYKRPNLPGWEPNRLFLAQNAHRDYGTTAQYVESLRIVRSERIR